MGKFDKYKVELKNMQVMACTKEFFLDSQFFIDIDAPEVTKGRVSVTMDVKKLIGGDAFEIKFGMSGVVQVPCDRCLDDMDVDVVVSDKLMVKLGDEYAEDGDWVIIPEDEGEINVAWFMYEFIALAVPMKHVHPSGKCNKAMAGKLSKHLSFSADDGDMTGIGVEEDEDLENPSGTPDPRWNELKKILDNN
ncbi:MAG: DUF177 domain-containing protein [Bacteroidaceae bacterium]|nr:DUF177 domain-containing protein [Bacteroidaceae bacterium]